MAEEKQRVTGFLSSGDPDPLAAWPAFSATVRSRLDAGRAEYGDRSFSASPAALLRELQQEALDLAGWGFVLHERIAKMLRELATASQGEERTSQNRRTRRSERKRP